MPARLRPTAPIAADAILVGDPGRALLLAQELLEQPKMSNHARGLWGYSGATQAGHALTIQSTGMGGPSATVVLHDLAELGLRRAIRIGTCTALSDLGLGEIVVVKEAQALCGSFRTHTGRKEPHNGVAPDLALSGRLEAELPSARAGIAVSLDTLLIPEGGSCWGVAAVADMQTAALLAAGARLEVAIAALLIVAARSGSEQLPDEELAEAVKRAGTASAAIFSS